MAKVDDFIAFRKKLSEILEYEYLNIRISPFGIKMIVQFIDKEKFDKICDLIGKKCTIYPKNENMIELEFCGDLDE